DAGAKVNGAYETGFDEEEGYTALIAASESGDLESVQALLEAGADLHARSKCGITPLRAAASAHKPEVVQVLLDAGARREEVTEHFLEVLEFPGRLRQPSYRQAVKDLAQACGVKPKREDEFPEGVLFDLSKSPLTEALIPERVRRLVPQILANGG